MTMIDPGARSRPCAQAGHGRRAMTGGRGRVVESLVPAPPWSTGSRYSRAVPSVVSLSPPSDVAPPDLLSPSTTTPTQHTPHPLTFIKPSNTTMGQPILASYEAAGALDAAKSSAGGGPQQLTVLDERTGQTITIPCVARGLCWSRSAAWQVLTPLSAARPALQHHQQLDSGDGVRQAQAAGRRLELARRGRGDARATNLRPGLHGVSLFAGLGEDATEILTDLSPRRRTRPSSSLPSRSSTARPAVRPSATVACARLSTTDPSASSSPAAPRLPDRTTRREVDVPGDGLPAAVRRPGASIAAGARRAGCSTRPSPAAHAPADPACFLFPPDSPARATRPRSRRRSCTTATSTRT